MMASSLQNQNIRPYGGSGGSNLIQSEAESKRCFLLQFALFVTGTQERVHQTADIPFYQRS